MSMPPPSPSRSAALWARWKRLAHRAAEIQAYVLLTVLYFVVVVPIGMMRRSASQALLGGSGQPSWHRRTPDDAPTDPLQEARRQF